MFQSDQNHKPGNSKRLCRLFVSLIACLLFTGISYSQEKTVTGEVINAEDGLGVIGATVVVPGTTIGTVTDFMGNFTLSVPDTASSLEISFVGLATQVVEIDETNTVNVTMQAEAEQLEEIVVTAMAIEREKKEIGFSVTTVKADELNQAKESNLVNALAGKVAGVNVTSSSGTLGGSSKILIRGASSLSGGNQPLFVVDGIPVSNSNYAGSNNERISGADVGNRIADINPDDIESVTVLKGPNAAALYGARAKDGVIMITTKKGKPGSPTSVELNSSVHFQDPVVLPDIQTKFAQGSQGKYNLNALNGWGPKIEDVKDTEFPTYDSNFIGYLTAHPDNIKDFYETGLTFNSNVAIAGGQENSAFRLSYSNLNQSGVIPGSKLGRNTVSLSSSMNFKNDFRSSIDANYAKTDKSGIPLQGGSVNAVNGILLRLPTTIGINDLRDYKNPDGTQVALGDFINNPYWTTLENGLNQDIERVFGNIYFEYKPFEWLRISERLGTDFATDYRRQISKKTTRGIANGSLEDTEYFSKSFSSDFIVTITKDFMNDFSFNGIFGHNVNDESARLITNSAQDFEVDNFYDYSNAKENNPDELFSRKRIFGVYGNVGISYQNYLFLEATGRNDWSSTLPVENNSYFYPSVSTSAILTQAIPALKNEYINYMKVRASASQVGSDEDPYQLQFSYLPYNEIFVPFQNILNSTPHGGELAYFATNTLPAIDLKPQKKNSWEIGMDGDFFSNRVGVDATYYYEITKDQIVAIPVPPSTGFNFKNVNVGSISNKGIEILVDVAPVANQHFTWKASITFSRNVQTVVELSEGVERYSIGSAFNGIAVYAEPGKSFGLYGRKWKRDEYGNIVINETTGLRELDSESTRLGNIEPDFTSGVNNSFKYKNVFISFLVDIRSGGVIYSNSIQSLRYYGMAEETVNVRENYQTFIDKGVNVTGYDEEGNIASTKENATPVKNMETFWQNYSSPSSAESSTYDASFIKLREVRIGYDLPAKWMDKVFLKNVTVAFEGRNLWLIKSNIPHIDPEANLFGSSSNAGAVEWYNIPPTRSYGFNVRVNF